jgi:hypothetical protein
LNIKAYAKLILIVAVTFCSAFGMYVTRTTGLSNASYDQVFADLGNRITKFSNEAAVLRMARAVHYYQDNPRIMFENTAILVVFPIPRAFWPSKPIKMEIWFPRVYESERRRSGYSASMSFMGPLYGDFGYVGAFVAIFAAGLAFGRLERWYASKWFESLSPSILFGGVLLANFYFLPRQLGTGVMQTAYIWLIFLGVWFILRKRYRRVGNY